MKKNLILLFLAFVVGNCIAPEYTLKYPTTLPIVNDNYPNYQSLGFLVIHESKPEFSNSTWGEYIYKTGANPGFLGDAKFPDDVAKELNTRLMAKAKGMGATGLRNVNYYVSKTGIIAGGYTFHATAEAIILIEK